MSRRPSRRSLAALSSPSTLRAYVNGTLQLTATDTQYASGKAGLATFNATASFDDVTVTSQ